MKRETYKLLPKVNTLLLLLLTIAEMYLAPCQSCMNKIFCENTERVKARVRLTFLKRRRKILFFHSLMLS